MILRIFFTLCLCSTGSFLFAQQQISVEKLKKHVAILAADSLEGRGFGSEKGKVAAGYIATEFQKAGIKAYQGNFIHEFKHQVNIVTVQGQNVIGIIEGTDPELKNEYIVLGGHYDHLGIKQRDGKEWIYNGADDNASGVATIIEIGRKLALNKDALKRSVLLIAFDGEESGLIGSKALLESEIIPLPQIKIMFSIDMVGMYKTYNGLDMRGMEMIENWQWLFEEKASTHAIRLQKTGTKLSSRTDTEPFGLKGIPAVHVTTGTKSPYHKPEDDAHLLEYEEMAKVAAYLYAVTEGLANTDRIVPVNKNLIANDTTTKNGEWFEYGARLNLGANRHNYPNEFFKGKSVFAIETGVFAKAVLLKRWAIQPELLYATNGSNHSGGLYRAHAVSVPVNILFALATTNGFEGTFYLAGGAYYSYYFDGSIAKQSADYKNVFADTEYGINLGFIMEVENVQLGFSRKIGLSNLYQDDQLGSIVNNGNYLTLGLNF